jgi:thioesterase domain-containing protein
VEGYAQAFPHDIPALARHHIAQMREHRPHGPYVVGGWSISGVVAFEVGMQLRDEGEEVPAVILFDTLNFANIPGQLSMRRLRQRWQRALKGDVNYQETISFRLRQWRDRLREWLAPSPDDLVPATSQISLLAAQKYVPETCAGRVVLVRSEEVTARFDDPTYGWSEVVTGELDIRTVPGSHVGMFDACNSELLAGIVEAACQAPAARDRHGELVSNTMSVPTGILPR